MTDPLDGRIRRLLTEIDDAAPAPHEWSRVTLTEQPRPVRWLVPAIVLSCAVVLAVVVAFVVVPGDRPSRVVTVPSTPVPSSEAPSPTSARPTVTVTTASTVTPPTAGPPSSPAGPQLSAEQAAELSAAGNADALSMFGRMPASGTYSVLYCDDASCGQELGDRPADTAPVDVAATLTYVDVPLLLTVLGVDPAVVREQPLDEWLPAGAPSVAIVRPEFFRGGLDPAAQRADVGFATSDIERMLETAYVPDRSTVMDVAVPAADIDAAVRADPVWSPDLQVSSDGDTVVYDWHDPDLSPFDQDLMRSSPMRPLGLAGQLSVTPAGDGAHVLRTIDPGVMADAVAGTGGSALTGGPYAPALGLLPTGRLVQLIGQPGGQLPRLDLPADIDVDPFEAVVVAVTVDPDGVRTDSYYVYADEVSARANSDAIADTARNGQPADEAADYPASPGAPDAVTEVVGPVVHVTTRGFNSGPPVHIGE